ncbi:MAG: CBS domain-containing protein [Candidatus Pacearchaeota archaeon]
MKVSEVMSKAVIIDDSISLKDAALIMSKKNIASVIVVKDGIIKGIVTERDILNNLNNLDKPVSKSMNTKIITISHDSDISEAAKIMASKGLRRLPVIKNGKLAGAVSLRDIIKYAKKNSKPSEDEGDFFFN